MPHKFIVTRLKKILCGSNNELSEPKPSYTEFFPYKNFNIPVDLVNLTGGGPETFKEFSRVMNNNSLGYASCFIENEEIIETAQLHDLNPFDLKFRHRYQTECWINNPLVPMGAVAFTKTKIDELLAKNGLIRIGDFKKGNWSRFWKNTVDGQDGFIFKRSNA